MNPRRDVPETRRTVVDRIHGSHDRQQHLGRTDVAGGLLPADVLFAGLQGQPQRRLSVDVPGDPHQPPGKHALVPLTGGEKTGVGAAEAHGHSEALGAADDDVRAHFSGGCQQAQAEQIGGDDAHHVALPALADERLQVRDGPAGGGILDEPGERVGRRFSARGIRDQFHPDGCRAGAHHLQGLREGVLGNEQLAARSAAPRVSLLLHVEGQEHGFRGCGALVQHGGVGDVHGREVRDHGLEIQQGLQTALGDLRLIGRVGGVPARVLEDVPEDDGGRVAVVVAHADAGSERPVGIGDVPGFAQKLLFGEGLRQFQRTREPNALRHGPLHQLFEGAQAQNREHPLDLRGAGADVPRRKQLPKRIPVICLFHG